MVVLDLCAAPGGWTQIASRECGPQTHIVAVDILPIRKLFPKSPQQTITTIVGDITTDKCKSEINRAIAQVATTATNTQKKKKNNSDQGGGGGTVDVVLHDGAPNIGASYDKDAYEQIELAVHALRCATHHLKRGGTFVTKIYRSRDSASYHWVIQQLFETVTSFKPKASRPQSAEIFYICQGYHAPAKLDPRLLDPKHIFEMVQGDTTGGGAATAAATGAGGISKFHVFHKNWDQSRRHRDGYDTEHLEFASLRHVEPLQDFILKTKGSMGAIQMLSSCTGFSFTCPECINMNNMNNNNKDKDNNKKNKDSSSCHCQFLLNHPLTTPEIKECLVDLKVLNKGDFKGLMLWRDKMILSLEHIKDDDNKDDDGDDDDDKDDDDEMIVDKDAKRKKKSKTGDDDDEDDDDEDEDEVQKEIQALRERKLREKKKSKKKERKLAAKKRRQAALGMDLNAIDVQEDDQFFSLNTLKSSGDLNKVAEVNLDQVTDDQVFGVDHDSDDDDVDDDADALGRNVPDQDEETGYSFRLEKDLDFAYNQYLEKTKNGAAKSGTKAAKRSKKLMREKLAQESHEDHELLLSNQRGLGADAKTYAKLLQGPRDSDDDDDDDDDDSSSDEDNADDDDDGFDAKPMTPKEHEQQKKKTQKVASTQAEKDKNPLIHQFPDDPSSVKTARWFSNPLFASIGQAAESAQEEPQGKKKAKNKVIEEEDDVVSEDDIDAEDEMMMPKAKRARTSGRAKKEAMDNGSSSNKQGLDADDVLAMIPKTDKQKRHEKRLKALERDERRQARKAKKLGESEGEFSLVPADDNDDEEEEQEREISKMEGISEEKKQKLLEARKLIKAGMGGLMDEDTPGKGKGFEVVEAERPLPLMDSRNYNSDNEEYDSDDYAKTMALGTMMLRKSKAKALVDASYNRYAWNDPSDLPEWFVDDENRHYRPQLPIPDALLQKMKEKMVALSTKPIAKVAEARARKNRKAKLKLASAKKKAQALAGSSEMSESMKLKQISKALRSADGKSGGKESIVSKKGKKGVKGAVMVDKRMKNDKRSMERAQKKRKNGKKGGLTGSKRRRHHA